MNQDTPLREVQEVNSIVWQPHIKSFYVYFSCFYFYTLRSTLWLNTIFMFWPLWRVNWGV